MGVLAYLVVFVGIALELMAAIAWDAVGPSVMDELISLGACTFATLGVIGRCCCAPRAQASTVPTVWTTAIAVFMVITFACAVNVSYPLYMASMLLVPAVVGPLAMCARPEGAGLTSVLGLAAAALALLATYTVDFLYDTVTSDPAMAITAGLCCLGMAAHWALAQLMFARRWERRPDHGSVLMSVMFRASVLIALVFLATVAMNHIEGDVEPNRWAEELEARSPRLGAALSDMDNAVLVEDRCVRMPFGDPVCLSLPANDTAPCVDLALDIRYCPSTRTVATLGLAAIFGLAFLLVTYVRLHVVSALGAPTQASVCLLARLGRLALAANGVIEAGEEGATQLTAASAALGAAAGMAAVAQILHALLSRPPRRPDDDRRSLLPPVSARARSDAPELDALSAGDQSGLDSEMFKRWRELRDLHEFSAFMRAVQAGRTPTPPAQLAGPARARGDPEPPAYDDFLRAENRSPSSARPWFTMVSSAQPGSRRVTSQHICANCGFATTVLAAIRRHVRQCAAEADVQAVEDDGWTRSASSSGDAGDTSAGSAAGSAVSHVRGRPPQRPPPSVVTDHAGESV